VSTARDVLPATIQPIETAYAGRLFRSRLEARWAVFYDAIGVPWMYEPEGFQLADDVRYLPDFFLPHLDSYIEIKPTEPTESETRKAELLAVATRRRVFVFWGLPGYHTNPGYPSGQIEGDGAYLYDGRRFDITDGQAAWDNYYTWCVCPACGRFGIEFDGRGGRVCVGHSADDKDYTCDDPRLLRAYDRANRARFEERA